MKQTNSNKTLITDFKANLLGSLLIAKQKVEAANCDEMNLLKTDVHIMQHINVTKLKANGTNLQ